MKQSNALPRRYPDSLADLRVQADSWDGPFYRLYSCGINDHRKTPAPHALFMDAMEAQGCWEYVISGSMYYKLGNERHRVDAGQAVVSRRPDPGWMLRPVKDTPVQALWLALTGEQALRVFDFVHLKYGQIQTFAPNSKTVRLARKLVALASEEPRRSAHFWSDKTFQWMSTWWREAEENHTPRVKVQLDASAPSRLISYAPRTVKSFATEIGYSVAHLSRKLSKQWHRSPGRVLREVRLDDAALMLRTTKLNINEISTKVGFSTSSSFSRAFRQKFRQTPRAYRRDRL